SSGFTGFLPAARNRSNRVISWIVLNRRRKRPLHLSRDGVDCLPVSRLYRVHARQRGLHGLVHGSRQRLDHALLSSPVVGGRGRCGRFLGERVVFGIPLCESREAEILLLTIDDVAAFCRAEIELPAPFTRREVVPRLVERF